MKEQLNTHKQKTEQQVVDQVGRITSKLVDRVVALAPKPKHSGDYSVLHNGDTTLVADHKVAGVKRSQVAAITPNGSHEAAVSYERSFNANGVGKKFTGAFVDNPGDEKTKHLGDIVTQIPEQAEQHGEKLNIEDGSAIGETAHTLASIHEAVVHAERHINN